MMNPRRFGIMAAALCGTVILLGWVIAAVAGFGLADIKNTHAAPNKDRATELAKTGVSNAIARPGVTAIAEAALPDSSQMPAPETPPVQIAAMGTSDV